MRLFQSKRRLWILLFVLTVLSLILVFEPTRIAAIGFLRGESFHRWRPTSYWREVLRKDGQAGRIREETLKRFQGVSAGSVLIECMEDPDRNVRWPAVSLAGRHIGMRRKIFRRIRKALLDEDLEVQLQAMIAIAHMGPNGMAAIPELVQLRHHPEPQASYYADLALWEVAPTRAWKLSGWKTFESAKWGFSAIFPSANPTPQRQHLHQLGLDMVVHSFKAQHNHVSHYVVAVSEYPPEVLDSWTEEERLESLPEAAATMLGGEVSHTASIELAGRMGIACEIKIDETKAIRTRWFCSRTKLYNVQVVFDRKYWNEKAIDFFFDSFKFTDVAL